MEMLLKLNVNCTQNEHCTLLIDFQGAQTLFREGGKSASITKVDTQFQKGHKPKEVQY